MSMDQAAGDRFRSEASRSVEVVSTFHLLERARDGDQEALESPLEQAIGREAVECYELALQRLTAEEREAIIARVEMGFSFEELAEALGKPTPDAARKTAHRALVRLAEEMKRAAE